MGDVERNENAICVYPRVQYCMCESCWRRFTHVLIDRACAYSCNGLHTPSSSPLSIVAFSLSPFNLYLTTLVYFCSVSLSLCLFRNVYAPLFACSSLSLSLSPYLPYYALSSLFILSFSILLCSSLRLSVSFLKLNSLSRSSRLSVYIYNDTGYIFCLRFFLQAIASFFPSWRFYHVYLFSVCHLLPLIVTCVPFRNFWRHRIENLTHFYRANKSKIFAVTHYIFYWFELILNYIFILLNLYIIRIFIFDSFYIIFLILILLAFDIQS